MKWLTKMVKNIKDVSYFEELDVLCKAEGFSGT
jgi:hypothetical protein